MVGTIQIENVSKSFQNQHDAGVTHVLDHISLTVRPGEFLSFIGPSGCGKSTLLRLISGFIFPDSGDILTDGTPVTGPGVDRGFMFQDHVLFPWLTIHDNVAFGLKAQGKYRERKGEVETFLRLVGLSGYGDYYPHQVSGGMQQRASLARVLIGRPNILLLDEPLGALDAFTRMNMQEEIQDIWLKEKMTMIMVTHDIDEAVYMSDRVAVMSTHPGKIVQIIPIDLPRPRARDSTAFFQYKAEILKSLHYGKEEEKRTGLRAEKIG